MAVVSDKPEGRSGSLSVVQRAAGAFETFVKITADGSVTAYNGHVDLGTGIRTALGQIVAEELDVSFARVVVVLGDTAVVPNQGATIASETIQVIGRSLAPGGGTGAAISDRARRRAA